MVLFCGSYIPLRAHTSLSIHVQSLDLSSNLELSRQLNQMARLRNNRCLPFRGRPLRCSYTCTLPSNLFWHLFGKKASFSYPCSQNMPMRNGIFPHISKQGCQSHQQLQLSWMVSLWALKGTQEGKNTCHLAAIRVQALFIVSSEELRMWKNRILAPGSSSAYQRSNFSEPRFCATVHGVAKSQTRVND